MNQQNKLSIYDCVRSAFKTTLDHFFLFFTAILAFIGSIVGLFIIAAIAFIVLAALMTKDYAVVLLVLIGFCLGIAGTSIFAGFCKMTFDVFDTGTSRVGVLFTRLGMGFKFMLLQLVVCAVVGFGMLLLIVPGIYWLVRYSLAPYIMVEKNTGIFESMRESWQLTSNNKWNLLGVLIIVTILSALAQLTIVGVFIALPMALLMMVYVYRWLQRNNVPVMQ